MRLFACLLLILSPAPFIFADSQSQSQNTEHTEKQEANKSNSQTQAGSEEAEKTLKVGILSFPVSQQPNPLIAFGQNMLEKKQAQALLVANEFKGDKQYFINIIPSVLYNFTDNLSIFMSYPIAVRYRQGAHHSSGPGDALIQLEYAFYTKAHRTYYDQATLVINITIPTGSTRKKPVTGIGANSFFIGATFSRLGINWLYFTSHGAIFPASSHRTQYGNQLLYQFGLGRRIANTAEWLFVWMVEVDGTYSGKNVIKGKSDPNSGGNVIYLTPSLWISSVESLTFQIGIGVPIQQHLFGHQRKNDYLLQMNTSWTF